MTMEMTTMLRAASDIPCSLQGYCCTCGGGRGGGGGGGAGMLQARPNSFIRLCKLACSGLASHIIRPHDGQAIWEFALDNFEQRNRSCFLVHAGAGPATEIFDVLLQMQYDRVIAQEQAIDAAAEKQLSRRATQAPASLIKAHHSGAQCFCSHAEA